MSAARLICALGLAAAIGGAWVPQARSQANVQDGDNSSSSTQEGNAISGDAVSGGQAIAVSSDGRTLINATNTSENARARTGDVDGSNELSATVGQVADGSQGFQITTSDTSQTSEENSAGAGLPPLNGTTSRSMTPLPASVSPGPSGPAGPVGPALELTIPAEEAGQTPRSRVRIGYRDLGASAADLVGPMGPVGPSAPAV